MSPLAEQYLSYVTSVRRYSERTRALYSEVLDRFESYVLETSGGDTDILVYLTPQCLRSYEVKLLGRDGLSPRTVNLHLSVLSGFCRFLVMKGHLASNPVRLVTRPKMQKRLPEFYRDDTMERYFEETAHSASRDELEVLRSFEGVGSDSAKQMYLRRLRRLIISLLHSTGIRRSELIALNVGGYDPSRFMLKVKGKGDKEREVPLLPEVCDEIDLYMQAVEAYLGMFQAAADPLLLTASGKRLYPVFVDRAVKEELGGVPEITARKSPHVLRHTLATELLNEGSDLNSIKELLGHSSLAATQVYTHNSIEKLKSVYDKAHPRAKDK